MHTVIMDAPTNLAIITGITGQDGSYLADLLLSKGYKVIGLNRRTSLPNTESIKHILTHPSFEMREFDMTDVFSMIHAMRKLPTYNTLEIYNLAAQSHVLTSFYQPETSANVDAIGTLRILEAIRILELKNVKFYQASTSELFGKVAEIPQNEKTPFHPRSPYGVAKLYSFWIVKNYRESYGMFACNGIAFNHESERRGSEFVSRKITRGIANCLRDEKYVLTIGNMHSKRDWGHAIDYVEGMWKMLQADTPDDYVLATGETHTVQEFIELAFAHVNITIRWEGEGTDEKGYDASTGRLLISVDSKYYRPAEVDILIGDASKAQKELGWVRHISFNELVKRMVESDCAKEGVYKTSE
jgi:GDPmannose 4,6-dehydratase